MVPKWQRHHRALDGQPWERTPPPSYERRKLPAVPPRDRFWRRDAIIAIDDALRAGDLELHEAVALRAILSYSDDTGQVTWAAQATLAKGAGWNSDRTFRRWLRAAEAKGWVAVEHRSKRLPDGTMQALTNLTVVLLPEAVEQARRERKASGRAKNGPTPKAPQNRSRAELEEERRPMPPMRTPIEARTPVLPELPEPVTDGRGAALAERARRFVRAGP